MKVLWLCNMVPSAAAAAVGSSGGGLWVDHVLSDLSQQSGITLRILCRGENDSEGVLEDGTGFRLFRAIPPEQYSTEQETCFVQELRAYQPDVIHIWGTEYGHTLAMVRAAKQLGMEHRIVVSIQGLCSILSLHYTEGLPYSVCRGHSFRDLLRWDGILQQKQKFARRGELECEALRIASHVIGRTDMDRFVTGQINPNRCYHFCNETLREPFYSGQWSYADCRKHRVFASGCGYPIKGFHYLLEAMEKVRRVYPDAVVAVPGESVLASDLRSRLHRTGYQNYLARLIHRYGMENSVEFLGSLSAEQMRQEYLKANVFVLPSTMENSPNSLGEAMLLGAPCVAADVGGVTNLMTHVSEGYVYHAAAPEMLAGYICQVFALEDRAAEMGARAAVHARKLFDPETNLRQLLEIYRSVSADAQEG